MIVVVFASYNVYRTHQSDIISKLMLANIEALADIENLTPDESKPNERQCFKKWRKASEEDDLAIWDWVCQDCESYWLLEGSMRSKCYK